MLADKKKRRGDWNNVLVGAFCVGFLSALGLFYLAGERAEAARDPIYRQLDLFGEVLETVRRDYVERVEDEKLMEAAVKGVLSSLDPHSAYLDAKTFENMQIYTRGEFGGLGLEVTMEKGWVKVITPIAGTPAEKAGMRAGDFITHLDGKPIMGMDLMAAVETMRGKPGTSITLTVRREGKSGALEITIVRDIIRITPVRHSVEGDVGYLRITTFSERAASTLRGAISKIDGEIRNPIGYILDLRNNPGGLLDQAVSVTDTFLSGGEIVSTRGRDRRKIERYNARAGDYINGKPLIILINGGSASASEIVAGALQDHRRATVLGTLSFGKGSVQTIRPLSHGHGAIRITTARYYTPSGKKIQAAGVKPDLIVHQAPPEGEKSSGTMGVVGETDLRKHLDSPGSEQRSGSASYVPADKTKDTQLNHALRLLREMRKNSRALGRLGDDGQSLARAASDR